MTAGSEFHTEWTATLKRRRRSRYRADEGNTALKRTKQLLNCRITAKNINVFSGFLQKIKCFQLKFGSVVQKSLWQTTVISSVASVGSVKPKYSSSKSSPLAPFDASDDAQEIIAWLLHCSCSSHHTVCQQSAVARFRSQPQCSGTLCQMTFSLHHQFLPFTDF